MTRNHIFSATAVAAGVALAPSLALAHPGHGVGLIAGVLHPFTGADHLMAMVGVGLWAAALGGRARLALPAAFMAAMTVGAAAAMATGYSPAMVEPVIAASVILLSVAVGLALRLPVALAAVVVALFGAAHGMAHGAEGTGLGFGLGMLAATALLHGAGVALGLQTGPVARRVLGGLGLMAGLSMVMVG